MSDVGFYNKYDALGMNPSTASARLRKMVLWKFIVESGNDTCFRCGEKIASIDEMSIEHKQPWMSASDPVAAFFDVENIAFSHMACNSRAALHLYSGRRREREGDGFVWCPECRRYLPPESFGYRWKKDSPGQSSLRSYCNDCRVARKSRGASY